MRKSLLPLLTFFILVSFFMSCTFDKEISTVKFASTDPFKETITPSQTFTIVGKEDNVVEGKSGTLIVIPAGSFKDANGNTINEKIEIELTEALSLEDMILSNLTTTSDGNLLQTDGMLYLNATMGGKQLHIDAENPIYIEIPTEKKIPGMMAYKGLRDENGNMNWIEPKALEQYLVTVDMDLLDFLPNGFADSVQTGLPFRKHKILSKALVDSLYYSLTPSSGESDFSDFESVDFNEPFYNRNKQVVNGKYTEGSYSRKDTSYKYYDSKSQTVVIKDSTIMDSATLDTAMPCGINPASIKVINSDKYQNTLIATREFEIRLQTIFKSCRTDILEMYINSLEKNLWELDSTAMIRMGGDELASSFETFYKQKLTNVENGKVYAALLQGYYKRKLAEIENQLRAARAKIEKELKQKNEVAAKVATEYKELLFKRETYRMERYGFEWSSTGWINIDKENTIKEDWYAPLEVTVENAGVCDRVYTYVVFKSMKSIYRLNTDNNQLFYVGNSVDRQMIMPKDEAAVVMCIGYAGETPYFGSEKFTCGKEKELNVKIKEASLDKIKRKLRKYDDYAQENRIDVDLKYMAFFANEKKRQEKLREEAQFIRKLVDVAFPCCAEILDGKLLFNQNCSPCHKIDLKSIGPALAGLTSKHSMEYLIKFTRDNNELRRNGDAHARKVYNDYNGSAMPEFNLTDQQIRAIYKYIDENSTVEE